MFSILIQLWIHAVWWAPNSTANTNGSVRRRCWRHGWSDLLDSTQFTQCPPNPSSIPLHGDYGIGGNKWHGAAEAKNGVIVCVPANWDKVLCIHPGDPDPILTKIGDVDVIQTGRHRTDRNYKYLGSMMGTNGKVYVFPSGSEYVLEVDAVAI
jgi:hypothetical protein